MEKPDIPNSPKPDLADKQYQFNLGLYRIETLSEILKVCAKKYRTAILQRDEESVLDYQAMVNTLYTETFIYMREETDFKIKNVKQNREDVLKLVLDDFTSLNGEDQTLKRLQQVRSVYLEIRKLLQKVGIDIPEKETIGETEAFTQS